MKSGHIPEWALALEPVRKLPTKTGSRIRNCIYRALEKDPPEWAKKRLEVSISKEVYKGNACGPTKRAVVSVLTEVEEKIAQEKVERRKRKKMMRKAAICFQCGDVGFDEYVYCFICVKFAVHRYCLPEMPKTSDEIVRWVCDDCEALSSLSCQQKILVNTRDRRCAELVISTSTTGSNKKSISQSSLEEDDKNDRTGLLLEYVHENLGSIGNACLADEPNENNNWSQKENVPTKHEHQRDTSQHLDGVKEVIVEADESLQTTNLRKKTEFISTFSGKEEERLHTTSDQKGFDGELLSVTSQHHDEEVDEVLADNLSKRPKLVKGNDISSPVLEKEKQKQTTTPPSRFLPLRNEDHTTNSARICRVKSTIVVVEGSSYRTKLDVKRHISITETPEEKQMRLSSSLNQLQSRQSMQFGDRSRYHPLRNKRKKDWSRSVLKIAKQRYNGPSSWKTSEAGRTMHNTLCNERKKDRYRSLLNIAKKRYSGPSSWQTREAGRPMHIPTRSNVNEEVSQQTHELRNPTYNTFCNIYKEGAKVIISKPVADLISYSVQVKPVVDPIWWGQFDILNKRDDTLGGFVAHLSSLACQQVIEEARLLPAVLELEMVPVPRVWPKSFQITEPSDDNIALYFFPSDRRYEKVFDRLVVAMSDQELAMRTTTKNAELLMFSSTKLPIKYWRLQNKYFIWGVFKAKRSISSQIQENRVNTTLGLHVNHAARY